MYLGNNAQYQPFINAIAGQKFKAAMMGLGGSASTPLYDQQRAAMTDAGQPGQVVTDTSNPPPPPGVPSQPQGGAGDGGSNGVGVSNATNTNGTPLPAVGDPRAVQPGSPTQTQKSARMPKPNSMKGLGV